MSDVCGFFQEKAAEAVDDWDGQDNADLLEKLADAFGISLYDLVKAGFERCVQRGEVVILETRP